MINFHSNEDEESVLLTAKDYQMKSIEKPINVIEINDYPV